MNVFRRIHDIFSSNVNHVLDNMEDPQKMVRYTINEMENTLEKAKASLAQTESKIKGVETEIKEYETQVNRWEVRSQMAVNSNKDDLAREAIEQKMQCKAKLSALNDELVQLKSIKESQCSQISKLSEKLLEIKNKERSLVDRARHAKEKIEIDKQLSDLDCSNAIRRFRDLEEKVERLEARAQVSSTEFVSENEFSRMEAESAVEKELAELKARA